MTTDIGKLLNEWPYDPHRNVRVLELGGGREVIQIRVDQGGFQGLLEMHLDGRPDGKRPHECEFCLDHFRGHLAEHKALHGGEAGFSLSREQCRELFDESFRVYQRYVFLLQLQDYRRVIRDTKRNMGLFRFVNRYAENVEDRERLEKWWPYILRLHNEARAMAAVNAEDHDRALAIVRTARKQIEGLKEVKAEEFHQERVRSLKALAELEKAVMEKRPPTQEERLSQELEKAVANEEFEKAAVLRDRLRELTTADEPGG